MAAYFRSANFAVQRRLCDRPYSGLEKFVGGNEAAPRMSTGVGDDRDR